MKTFDLEDCLVPSEDIVSREIEGELIIVPLVSGIGSIDDELFSLNETGRSIWKNLDGKKTVKQVVDLLAEEYDAPKTEIEMDVIGLVEELVNRRIFVESQGL